MFPYYTTGITADFARFQKSFVDANQQLSSLEKLLEKQSISACISNPNDRELELRSDRIDFCKEIAQGCVHRICGYSFCGNIALGLISLNAEQRKRNVHSQAEAVRNYCDGNCDRSW